MLKFMTVHMATVQFFERPKELMGYEQSDDLLFFVINEAYQVGFAIFVSDPTGRTAPHTELGKA